MFDWYLFYRFARQWSFKWSRHVNGNGYGRHGDDEPHIISGLRISDDLTRHKARHISVVCNLTTRIILQLRNASRHGYVVWGWICSLSTPTFALIVRDVSIYDVDRVTGLRGLTPESSHATYNAQQQTYMCYLWGQGIWETLRSIQVTVLSSVINL